MILNKALYAKACNKNSLVLFQKYQFWSEYLK